MLRRRDPPLALSVLLGLLGGAAYVAFDLVSEARLARGTLTGSLARLHDVIDHLIPLLCGALLGLCVQQLRLRKRLRSAEEAASRVEALRMRLQKVERDQAVWILAARVLHELNNPLHAIGLILDEQATLDGDEARRAELTERARVHAQRALAHLTALRGMRRSEPELERVLLDRMLALLADEARTLATADAVEVFVASDGPVEIVADPTYVRTILENLIDNSLHALRATHGGKIEIDLSTRGSSALVRVHDDGPLLSGEVAQSLFDPLQTTKHQGLGLGLPIARALARATGGDLTFDQHERKVFLLELPLSPA